ncbi:MAG: NADH-quinone oxidoreductase subunit NuoE family protein [Planctomycetota bacterium]|jgi:NADH:ubiquinone oxidoreductase subunit E
MAWKTIDRNQPAAESNDAPVLSEAVRDKIRSFFDRYETKRAALLPALQITQNALGHVSLGAMVEIAELLEIPPSAVFDTIGFYTHFWTHPKGKKVIVCCRSVSCAVMGGEGVLQAFKDELGIDEHQTTPDGKYSLVTEEAGHRRAPDYAGRQILAGHRGGSGRLRPCPLRADQREAPQAGHAGGRTQAVGRRQ